VDIACPPQTDGRFTWRKPQEIFQLDKAGGERLYQIGVLPEHGMNLL